MDTHTSVNTDHGIEQAVELLDQALTILDREHFWIAAAKVDDARNEVRRARGGLSVPVIMG